MSTQKDFFNNLTIHEKRSQGKKSGNGLKKYFFHWPLFILALLITMPAAVFYVKNYRPVYEIKASILIKEDKQAGGDTKAAMLNEIGITNSSAGVDNEIEILKSKKLIGTVVNDLQLWVSYVKKDGLFSDDLYTNSPVKITSFNHKENFTHATIKIIVNDDKSYYLKGHGDTLTKIAFGVSHKSDFGSWKLEPTSTVSSYKNDIININIIDPEIATVTYQNLVDASLPNKLATSVTLSINDKVKKRGKDVINYLIANYNSSSTIDKNQETKRTLDFLDQRLDSLSGELTTSEKGIEGFKSSRGLTDISSESQMQLENMQENDKNLNEINVKLNVIEGIDKYVNSNQTVEKAPATLGITDPALSNSIEKLAQLQLQHDKLAATLPETNPDFEPINNQIKTTKAAIRENVKNIKNSLTGTKEKLQSFSSKFEAAIKNMPSEERQYVSIKRQQTSKESLYTFLLQKREEVSVKYASNLTNNRIVDQAYAEAPKDITMVAYFVALLFGIGAPAALIFSREALSSKITNVTEISDALNVQVVAELPYEKVESKIALKENQANAVSEQLRALRIKLFYLHNEKEGGRVTLITSSISGEGKSFVSTNLAVALTFAFRKTVILELDMRKPKVSQLLGLSISHTGISNYLNGKATKNEIIQHSESAPGLDVISCGTLVNNPSELLEKKELKELISSLRDDYDDIIIDSPPVHLVPDAAILSRLSDITLYVIRQGFTDKEELDFIEQLIAQNQLQKMSIIFNGIEREKHGYGYKYDNRYYSNSKRSFMQRIAGDFKSRF